MAITLVEGHEPTPYEAPEYYCWSFLEFYYVNMKGPNKHLTVKISTSPFIIRPENTKDWKSSF